ncbi:unnamed protein product [Penicillium bialowiezense]
MEHIVTSHISLHKRMFNFIRGLRRGPKTYSPLKDHHTIHIQHDYVTREQIDVLQEQINIGMSAIARLQKQLNTHIESHTPDTPDTCKGHAPLNPAPYQTEVPSTPDESDVVSPPGVNMTWIDDIWVCSGKSLYLADAEEALRRGHPYLAMELAWRIINCNPFLFQHEIGQYDDSLGSLEIVEKLNESYIAFNNTESPIATGVANFIRARIYMDLEDFTEAYWLFEQILDMPGYGEKARVYQKAMAGLPHLNLADFGSSPLASTHALLEWNQED